MREDADINRMQENFYRSLFIGFAAAALVGASLAATFASATSMGWLVILVVVAAFGLVGGLVGWMGWQKGRSHTAVALISFIAPLTSFLLALRIPGIVIGYFGWEAAGFVTAVILWFVLSVAGGWLLIFRPRVSTMWRVFLIFAGLLILLSLAYWVYLLFFFSFERPSRVHEIGLADLNGNGYLDAYLNIGSGGNEPYVQPDYILFNDGNGQFTDGRELPDRWPGRGITLGDLNGDDLADILLDIDGGGIVYQINQGGNRFLTGSFLAGTAPGPVGVMQMKPELADLNGDGYLDVFAAGCCGRKSSLRPEGGDHLLSYSLVWLNDGHGRLVSNGQIIGQMGSNAVALADLNGDGSLDAFLANGRTLDTNGEDHLNTPNTVWFNDGQGYFTDSGQRLGEMESTAVALGDVNGDGFLDAVVGNRGADEVWLNDGQGNFSLGQRFGRGFAWSVFLADLDGDGDLDLVTGNETNGRVWLNDGNGHFRRGQEFSYGRYEAIALGDVTGDGIVDIFVAGVESYQVWRGVGDGRFIPDSRTHYR
ncbi:MAG: VCBS repeat-containing protein [Anaerolinea sp.]|nr:VCBS repeat-containing protein [Anaerolinea sp.]